MSAQLHIAVGALHFQHLVSFLFALMVTRYVFEVLDKCAIYILIAGSYTPYLQICLHDKPKWSIYLLAFIWLCAIAGVSVEACFPAWKYKPTFSLSMYLGMGWACVVCLPDLIEVVPQVTLHLLILGGVAYTGGVPFFVRNNNLDHRYVKPTLSLLSLSQILFFVLSHVLLSS